MSTKFLFLGIIIPFLGTLLLVSWIHPQIVRLAMSKDLVDTPNARKLQKRPVPVLGGIAVFWGIVVGAGVTSLFFDSFAFFPTFVAITVMMYMGVMDDIMGLSAIMRLIVEVCIIFFLVYLDRHSIDSLHGVFGIGELPSYAAVGLSVLAGTGIINAINLIDGVDGLSSGFCLMVCALFGFAFMTSGDGLMTVLAWLCVGSLFPFFMHNVFGKTSKMFIGDSGTLMLGTIMTIFVFRILDDRSRVGMVYPNMGVVAFTLSVLSIPVFDTLRVMISRILRKVSPFHPDKTHLHHLFIDFGFSHAGTSLSIIFLNLLNVICWLVSYQLGASPTVQFLVVLVIGVLNTTGFYVIGRKLSPDHIFYRMLIKLGKRSHIERRKYFLSLQEFLDKR